MGSRNRRLANGTTVHSTLGKHGLQDAVDNCAKLCQREVRNRVSFTHTEDWVRNGIFPPETLKLAAAAHRVVDGDASSYVDYEIGNHTEVRLWWNETGMIALAPHAMLQFVDGQSEAALYEHSPLQHLVPLMEVRDKIQAIATRWQRAIAVIRKMDEQATLGAFRYYLPGIMQLCSSDVPQEMPSRFTEPLWIGPWVPLIREAQETIAASALLPQTDADVRAKPVVFLTEHRIENVNTDVAVEHERWSFKV